ncbi:MAG: FAD-binding oxidoreductase [Chloroflexota bacterium]|nr:FAD-binding oxidoreductase [Chloroflexota bacterium]
MTAVLGRATIEELRQSVRGTVVAPEDADYDAARAVWNGMIDRRPALVVRCVDVADVVAAVQFARSQGLEIAARGGGHSLPGFSTTDGGLVIDLSPMRAVSVDGPGRRAVVEGGATWADVDQATQASGLAVTGGLVSTTGVGGFTLGGGVGWLMRRHGLASDNLIGAEVVTADGSVVRATESENADLLWGLRGGGGNFGVVTSFEFRLFPVGPTILGGPVFYPGEQVVDVLRGWRDATAAMPDDLTTLVSLGSAPPIPPVPESWHGQAVATVIGAYAGAIADGQAPAGPLRTLGDPIVDLLGELPYVALQSLVDPGWGAGARNYFTALFLSGLPDAAIDVLAAAHQSRPSPFNEIHLHQMGGAAARVGADASAFGNREAPFLMNIVARWLEQADDERELAWARDLRAAMQPFATGATYVNFLGLGDAGVRDAYDAERFARLGDLKHRWDPTNAFHLNQNIAPVAAADG